MSKEFDRDNILRLVQTKNWEKLIGEFKNNKTYQQIKNDDILKQLIDNYFIGELLNNEITSSISDNKYYLELFLSLHKSQNFDFKLNDKDYKKLILKIIPEEKNIEVAYYYAIDFPEEEICKEIINRFNEKKPKIVEHSQSQSIYVTENKNIKNIDARIGLFKSKQEYQFYKAVLEVFPNFLVIPNVALSAVIDFNQIQNQLSNEEKGYFFKALIDCAVIDTEDGFKAKYLVELDSAFHDLEKRKINDIMKDNILSNAGQKLLRVRQKTKNDYTNFSKLIRETLK